MKNNPYRASEIIKPVRGVCPAKTAILITGILLFTILVPAAAADNYEGGIPLEETKEGTVSGGIWTDSFYGMSSPAPVTVVQPYHLPDYTTIQWARLYVTVYCGNMENNYAGTTTVEFDGGSGYSQLGTESLNVPYTFPGKDYNPPAGEYGTGPVNVNSHCVRVTSDYLMWYDVTGRITGDKASARVSTAPADPQFDGRIKAITLIVAYDDGDDDTVHYWIHDGLDTDSYQSEEKLGEDYVIRTTFPTGELPPEEEWAAARLQVVHLASDDATYTLNEDEPVDLIASGSGGYSGYNAWDVTGIITPWEDSTLSCDRTDSFYKIFLAALSVRYPEKETGTLTATSSPPGAALFINGEETEYTTNLTIPDMPVGSYAVSVAHPHYEEADEQWVDVTADETTAVHFALQPLMGSLSVTSDPAGAQVFIDGVDTKMTTDALLNDVIIGEHTISIRLAGYRDEIQTVTVTEDETTGISFSLTPVTTGRGEGDDDAENAGYTGKELTSSLRTTFRGDVVTASFGTYTGLIEPGSTSWFTINATIPKGGDPTRARLFLYTTWGHNTDTKAGAEVPFSTSLDSKKISPDMVYSDRKGEGAYDYVLSTICYNVTDVIQKKGLGDYTLSVTNSGRPGEVSAIYGGTLVIISENETAPLRTVWLNEGCDAIIADEAAGITSDQATTTVPFPGNISTEGVTSADLTIISTAATGKGDDAHRVYFNDWEFYNVLTGGSSGISTFSKAVTPFLLTTANTAQVQSALMGTTGDYLENRNALLVITHTDIAGNTTGDTGLSSTTNPAPGSVSGTGKETFMLSSTGGRLHATELKSADGRCTLYIREGTQILDTGGAAVSTVTIQRKESLPGGNPEWMYTIGPQGATTDIPLLMEITGSVCTPEADVMVAEYDTDTGNWTDTGMMNHRAGMLTAGISHLGTYSIICSGQITDNKNGEELTGEDHRHTVADILILMGITEFLNCFHNGADAPEEEPVPAPNKSSKETVSAFQAPEETFIDYRNGTYDLVILSNPPEALITLDGIYTGETTPSVLTDIAGGSHILTLSREGFGRTEKEIHLTDDSEIRFDLSPGTYGLNKLKFEGYVQNGYDEGIGGVYVTSYPEGAQVYLDGRKTGLTTPEVIAGLKEGRHTIKVHNEQAEYPTDLKSVWVYPGAITEVPFNQVKVIARNVELSSDTYTDADFTVNGMYPQYTFPKEVKVSGVHPYITLRDNGSYISVEGNLWQDGENILIHPDEITFGNIAVSSEPMGAEIYIDGFPSGIHTPYTITNLSAGQHTFSVSLPGHLPENKEIYLVPRGRPVDAELSFLLKPYSFGSLRISSEPEGAKIYLYNKYSGKKTPAVFRYMDIGTIPVRLVSAQGTITIENAVVCPFKTAEYCVSSTQSE